jgi:hypothetical protein
MSWQLRNSIRLGSQKGFAALENSNDSEDINRPWEKLKRISKSQLRRI